MQTKHIPTLITLSVHERDAARELATNAGMTVSEWFGNMIRRQYKKKLPPRNALGRPAKGE